MAAEIRQKGIRRREFQRFITALEKLPDEVTEFEESMWNSPAGLTGRAVLYRWNSRFLCQISL